jgi:type I restriction enzyme M protein
VVGSLPILREEAESLSADSFKAWQENVDAAHPVWGKLADAQLDKPALRQLTRETKGQAKVRQQIVKGRIKLLEKLEIEREERIAEINRHADRETGELQDAIIDLQRICADTDESRRYFVIAEKDEIEENEFNLNLPRYVDTWAVIPVDPVSTVVKQFEEAVAKSTEINQHVLCQLKQISVIED